MKKLILSIIAIMVVLFFSSAYSFAEDGVLKIAVLEGKVFVKIHPSTEWKPAALGQVLNQKDSIKTEDPGKAKLELPDKSGFDLKQNTTVTVEDITWGATARKVDVNLSAGELKTIIKKVSTPSEFKVRTPTAICGARGTIFYTIVLSNGTKVYVEEGVVDIVSILSGESTPLEEGKVTIVAANGDILTPSQLSAEDKAVIAQGYLDALVAEPYTEPAGTGAGAGDVTAPEVTEENQASRV